MKKIIQKTMFVFVALMTMFIPMQTVTTQAQDSGGNILCTIFPFLEGIRFAEGLCSGDVDSSANDAVDTGTQLVQFGLSLVFVGIIAIAIFIIIKAALKYIRSEGNEEQVTEAQKAIKNVFIGIGALIVGVIGLVVILGIFNAGGTNPLNTDGETDDLQDTLLNE